MVTAALIIVATTLAGSIVANVLSLRWAITAKDAEGVVRGKLADEVVSHGSTRADLAATRFELVATAKALATANERADALAKELSDAINSRSLGDGLRPDDVDSRLLRLAAEAKAAGDPVPAGSGTVVPVDEPVSAGAADAAGVRNLHPIDVLK